jgi:hypothetical protein
MQPNRNHRAKTPVALRAGLVALVAAGVATAPFACNDSAGPTQTPPDLLIDNTMQDAVAMYTQDVVAPQGAGDGGYDGTYPEGSVDAPYAATGYADVQSPMTACSSCMCSEKAGYCLENGTSATFTSKVIGGYCSLSPTLAVGCNVLPAACAAKPTCACILDNVQPPLQCYPECTESGGYFDVFCNIP